MTRTRYASLLMLALTLIALIWMNAPQGVTAQVKQIPIQEGKSAAEELRPYMHAKLYSAQQVMRGLVTHNFDDIRQAAGSLKQTSLDAPEPEGDDKIDGELYEHFRLEFLRLTTQLNEMAEAKNLEGAAFVYQGLTANCMACHDYLNRGTQAKPK